ncbi:nicotinamidase [Geobacter sp. SVR]|uniref:nicotinamidase n=1 Tax=Geobacter sp. SVR TaxID=2495594 RepID=UPI00143EFF17|nr:nicotinamidase [Geobacter sp. SVR]BCS52561.1 nicotinamidase [Geobacter sp. SVR]GCF84001.1 nicotinamidase [Geobacter sp. SVR]
MSRRKALMIVDVQNDFCPGGALPVPEGDRVVEPLNRAAGWFVALGLPVFASRDWHPPVSRHFREWGGPWPGHCIQGTPGAAFHPLLRLPEGTRVFSKGSDPDSHGYSAFEGRCERGRTLLEVVCELGVGHLYVGGLATDYCVRATALEALHSGLEVTLLADAVAGVELSSGDTAAAVAEMTGAGVRLGSVEELLVQSDFRSLP